MQLRYKRICTFLFLFFDLFPNIQASACQSCLCSTEDDTTLHIDCHATFISINVLQYSLISAKYNGTLSILNLSQNNITHLPIDIFENSKHLKIIDLSHNLLVEIHRDTFKNLISLQTLILSYNHIKSFESTALPSLLIMNLSNNKIADLNVEFHKAYPQLEILNLSNNQLDDSINATFTLLKNLNSLDLSYNKFKLLDGENFNYLRQLTVLNLSHNLIQSLEDQTFPDSLLEINVGYNLLTVIPSTIKKIKKLNIEYNKISNVIQNRSTIINQFDEIRYLNLSGNLLREFPNLILLNLNTLDLSYNHFTNLPRTLDKTKYPALQTLIFSGNSIKNIEFISDLRLKSLEVNNVSDLLEINENSFGKLQHYENNCLNLTLANNKGLNIFHEKALQHLNLCFLNLSNNNFSYLSPKLFDNGLRTKYGVNLEGNPFHCNCSLQWMLNIFVPWLYITNWNLLENLRCETPKIFHGKRMVHWYNWKEQVLCEKHQQFSSRMVAETMEALSIRESITIHASNGMVIAVITTLSTLLVLVILGILITKKIGLNRRRINRRF